MGKEQSGSRTTHGTDLQVRLTRAGYALSRYFDFLPQLEKQAAARRYANRSRAE